MGLPQYFGYGDVYEFVFQLEDFLKAKCIPVTHAHTYFPYVLQGKALLWYRTIARRIPPNEGETKYERGINELLEAFGLHADEEIDVQAGGVQKSERTSPETNEIAEMPAAPMMPIVVKPAVVGRKRKMVMHEPPEEMKKMRFVDESLKSHIEDAASSHIEDAASSHIEDAASSHIEDAASSHIEDVESNHVVSTRTQCNSLANVQSVLPQFFMQRKNNSNDCRQLELKLQRVTERNGSSLCYKVVSSKLQKGQSLSKLPANPETRNLQRRARTGHRATTRCRPPRKKLKDVQSPEQTRKPLIGLIA